MSRSAGFFIAGTDTGVGKTRAGVAVVRALVRRGVQVAVMKPVAAGAIATAAGPRNEDALALIDAANVTAEYALVNPYCLRAPISPHLAAAEEGVSIDRSRIAHAYASLALRAECVVVEGAGGWLAPIGARETMADLARTLGLPILLVVGLKLGCLSHAQLTARAIEADGQRLCGWIANHLDPHFERPAENIATLERLLARPPLALIPHGALVAHRASAAPRSLPSAPLAAPEPTGCELSQASIDALIGLLATA